MMKRIPLVAMTVFAAGSLILIAANKPLVAPTPAQPRPIQKVYAVADLIIPIPGTPCCDDEHPGCCMECLAHGSSPQTCPSATRENHLMKLITGTVSPRCWCEAGGNCTIDYFAIGMSLVVSAPPEVQEQVCELLEALRRLQEVEVAVELKFISVGADFFERMGCEFRPTVHRDCHDGLERAGVDFNCPNGKLCDKSNSAVALSPKQVGEFLAMVQGDRRANVMQTPKLTLFSGQASTISAVDTQYFVTGMKYTTNADGHTVLVPENKPFDVGGIRACIQATVSADRKFAQIHLQAEHCELAGPVPAMPVTYFVTPVLEGGVKGPPVPFTQFIQQPKINKLNVDSKMCIPDGGTMLLDAGSLQREEKCELNTPVLSKVPYVNRLFKNVGYASETYHMLVMVTPHVIIASESACAKCANCKDGKCCDNCPKCCEQACKGCPKCKPAGGAGAAGEEESGAAIIPLPKAIEAVKKSPVELRAEKMAAKLVEKYHDACAKGETEKARKLARQALDLDPACFTKPAAAQLKGMPVGSAAPPPRSAECAGDDVIFWSPPGHPIDPGCTQSVQSGKFFRNVPLPDLEQYVVFLRPSSFLPSPVRSAPAEVESEPAQQMPAGPKPITATVQPAAKEDPGLFGRMFIRLTNYPGKTVPVPAPTMHPPAYLPPMPAEKIPKAELLPMPRRLNEPTRILGGIQ